MKNDTAAAPEPQETAPPAPAPAPAPSVATHPPRKLTALAWAEEKRLTKPADPRIPQSVPWIDPRHAVADRLHGWSDDAYNNQGPGEQFTLTEQDYLAALRAAPHYPTVAPHAAALAPSYVDRWRDFKPKAARKRGDKEVS